MSKDPFVPAYMKNLPFVAAAMGSLLGGLILGGVFVDEALKIAVAVNGTISWLVWIDRIKNGAANTIADQAAKLADRDKSPTPKKLPGRDDGYGL